MTIRPSTRPRIARSASAACSLLAVKVGQQQQIAAAARLAVHAAHDLRKEFAVEVGKDDADGVGSRQAEASRAGMRDVAELPNRFGDPRRASAR